MAARKLFQKTTNLLPSLFSGIMRIDFNPCLPIGGRLLLQPHKTVESIIKELKENPNKLKEHLEYSIGLACLTTKLDFATDFSRYGGFSDYNPESETSFKKPSAVAVVDVSKVPLLHIEDILKESDPFTTRAKQESESVTVIVMPTIIKGWHINEIYIENPFYLPDANENKLLELQSAFIEIMQLKADSELTRNNPKTVKAVENYIRIFTELAGGPKAFNDKLDKLNNDILSKGYELNQNSTLFVKKALTLTEALKQAPSP